METKKLSIVTITRNNHKELVDTLKSLRLLSDYQPIVINGGECNKTKEFLREQRIKHISGPDNGIADAFNKGIRIALKNDTDYIIFINSGDVVIDATYARKALDFLEQNRERTFAYGDIIFRDSLAGDIFMPSSKFNLGRGMPCRHQTMIYRKSVFSKVGLFDENYKIAMDYEHLCRMAGLGLNGQYIKAPPFVLMDGTGVSAVNEGLSIKECYRALSANGLMVGNRWSFMIRLSLFGARKTLAALKLDKVLAGLKRIKYTRFAKFK